MSKKTVTCKPPSSYGPAVTASLSGAAGEQELVANTEAVVEKETVRAVKNALTSPLVPFLATSPEAPTQRFSSYLSKASSSVVTSLKSSWDPSSCWSMT